MLSIGRNDWVEKYLDVAVISEVTGITDERSGGWWVI
jgi:hypothetical protein